MKITITLFTYNSVALNFSKSITQHKRLSCQLSTVNLLQAKEKSFKKS